MNPLDLKETITYTQELRIQLVSQLTKGGIPTDEKERELLAKTLNDLDKSVLSKEKITLDASNANTQREASNILNKVLTTFVMPKLEKHSGINKDLDLPNKYSVTNEVLDEMHIGVQNITLEEIMGDG